MTDIDKAFRKAYAKRLPGEAAAGSPKTTGQAPAVWIDDQAGMSLRQDEPHAVPAPHQWRSSRVTDTAPDAETAAAEPVSQEPPAIAPQQDVALESAMQEPAAVELKPAAAPAQEQPPASTTHEASTSLPDLKIHQAEGITAPRTVTSRPSEAPAEPPAEAESLAEKATVETPAAVEPPAAVETPAAEPPVVQTPAPEVKPPTPVELPEHQPIVEAVSEPTSPVEDVSPSTAGSLPDVVKSAEQLVNRIDTAEAAVIKTNVYAGTTAYEAWTEKLQDLKPSVAPPKPRSLPVKFTPVWEVDEVAIPDLAAQLAGEHLSGIGGQLERACREGLQTLAICSQRRKTGRSTVSIAVAQTAARSGLRVVLVDADVENPTLVDKLQLDMSIDWIDAISKGISIEEATVQSLSNGFSFVPLLRKSPSSLSNVDQYAKHMFDQLKHHYDLIVIDFSPLSHCEYGRSIPLNAELIDAVMMVEEMEAGDTESLEACARRIRAVGIDNIGLIENFSQATV